MRSFILTTILFTLLSIIAAPTLAQTTNWTHVAGELSYAETLSTLSDGSYLITSQSSDTLGTSELAKVSSTGDLLWERNFDGSTQKLIFAGEQSNGNLIVVVADGSIFQTDSNGDASALIGQLSPSAATLIRGLRYDVTFEGIAYFFASTTTSGLAQTLRASLDLESLAITTNLGEDEGYPNGVAFSDSGIRAELRSETQAAGVYFYDENLEVTSFIDITQPGNVFFSDLTFDERGNIYVTGTTADLSVQTGLIALIDTSKMLSWVKELPRPADYESLGLKHILARDGRLFIGGRSGPFTERIEGFVGEIDTEGNLLWETTIDVSNNNEAVISLEHVSGTNADELIAFGTGGLIDFTGPQRTFLTSISIMTSSINDKQLIDTPLFYPNPVDDILHIDLATPFEKIEIRNVNGILLDIITSDAKTINMSGYAAGIHFLETFTGKSSITSKVIKK